MQPDPASIIDCQLDAYNRRDLDGFLACYSPNAVLHNLTSGEQMARGHAGLRPIYQKRFENPDLHAVITNRMVLGNVVIDYENIRGIPGTNLLEAIVIYRTRDGLIDEAWTVRKE